MFDILKRFLYCKFSLLRPQSSNYSLILLYLEIYRRDPNSGGWLDGK